MTTDNRTNAQIVESANRLRKYYEAGEMIHMASSYRTGDGVTHIIDFEDLRVVCEAALVAAQGAAPQVIVCDYCGDALPSVASRAHIPTTPSIQRLGFSADKIVCPECVQRARGAAPVLPSSTVDEGELEHRVEEVIRDVVDMPLSTRLVLARAVVEAIGGESR